ncbi:MAG: hypothetical protein A2X46_03865 [Lentisphaerae bacterium GWF2_57_35]|nr:MAG: hypothetical protein A2X46_03865 [Lentisphaerae bacterium GWF2_57_35]
MLWQHFALWPWLALIAAPLLIHLFALTRPPAYRFSSLEFIRRIVRRTRRIERPQDWLIWLLRTLAIAAAVLMFLRPLLFVRGGGDVHTARHVVLVVDASASMSSVENAQSRFSSACSEAAEILGGLGAGDTANVVWMKAKPEAVFPSSGINFSYLRDSLRRARVTSEAADVASALKLGVDLLSGLPGRKEICILSDFQKTNWEGVDFKLPPEYKLFTVRVGASDGDNRALARLTAQPVEPLAGETLTLYAEVRNFSPSPRKATVYLNFDERHEQQEVSLEAWGQAAAVFTLRAGQAGSFPVTVRLSEDAFAGDNVRQLLLRVRDRLPIKILASEPETAGYWRRALETLPWAQVTMLASNQWPAEEADDILLLSGWDGAGAETVAKRLQAGRMTIWQPAPETPQERLAALGIAGPGLATNGVLSWETAREPYRLTVASPDDPCFALFGHGEYGDPAGGSFLGRLRLPRLDQPSSDLLLAYRDQVPALIRFRFPGVLYLWNLPLQSAAGDWAARPEFLPLLAELLLSGRTFASSGAGSGTLYPGQMASLPAEQAPLNTAFTLEDEQGGKLLVEARESNAKVYLAAGPVKETGLYRWKAGDETLGWSVVNFPIVESDLRGGAASSPTTGSPAMSSGREVRQAQTGLNLWPGLVALAGLFLLMESVAVWGASKT